MKIDIVADRDQARGDWINPKYLYYDYYHCAWILIYAEMMKEGYYPPAGKETGYIGSSRPIIQSGPFEWVCQIIGEVETRLAQCGTDREYAERFYTENMSLDNIAKRYSRNVDYVEGKIISIMKYVGSGKCQRWQSCDKCLDREKCRKKKRKPLTYQEWTGHRRETITVR